MSTPSPSPLILDYISRAYTYDPDTGIVMHKGKRAGIKRKGRSYLNCMMILDTKYEGCSLQYITRAHQIAWYLTYGVWAHKSIDHINNDASDNRLSNLRLANDIQNSHNRRKYKKNSTSRYKGVHMVKDRWRATIQFNKKQVSLGYYDSELDAAKAYNAKALELLGEYASLNIV